MDNSNKAADEYFISRTFSLAKKAEGLTSPNPIVGAVVVKDGNIVGAGYHKKAGLPHAEAAALEEAGIKANGGTIYVNLEPCSHFGKTPPCVYKIKESGIKRVVAAVKDPNPLVSGRGFDYLRNNGIEITCGILEGKARKLNEIFFKYITAGFPFITIKEALTLDGKIGYRGSKTKSYISSPQSLEHTHRLRFMNDAVMVSAKTVIKDDPMLDIRINRGGMKNKFLGKKWTKIILDADLSVPLDAKIFNTRGDVLIFTSDCYDEAKKQKKMLLKEKGAIIHDVYYNNNIQENKLLNIKEIFKKCAGLQITSILVEAGPTLFNSLNSEKLFDKLVFNITPYILGNEKGVSLFETLSLKDENIFTFGGLDIKKFGDELFLSYYPKFA